MEPSKIKKMYKTQSEIQETIKHIVAILQRMFFQISYKLIFK